MQAQQKNSAAAMDTIRKLQAPQTPVGHEAQNAPKQQIGSEQNAIQGHNNGKK
jgi:hypothetical protein